MELFAIGIDLFSMLITFVMLLYAIFGKKSALNDFFSWLLIIHVLTIVSSLGLDALPKGQEYILFIKISVALLAFFPLCGLTGFNVYVDNVIAHFYRKNRAIRYVPFIVGSILLTLWVNSFFGGFGINNISLSMFNLSPSGDFQIRTPAILMVVFFVILIIFNLIRVIIQQIKHKLPDNYCLSIYIFIALSIIFFLLAYGLDCFAILWAGITIGYFVIFVSIYANYHEKDNKEVKEVMDIQEQTDLIISQLQPHFMFNTLTAAAHLCKSDGVLASGVIEKFSRYLRYNLENIKNSEYVEFAEEMNHIRCYLWLEKVRFNDTIHIVYSIDTEHFKVPPLSVQPIVENAIRHGLTRKMGGGDLRLLVREYPDRYKIIIEDNGLGFDTKVLKDPKERNTSIRSISKRLNAMNGSSLEINSNIGIGTTAIITIRKDTEKPDGQKH